MTLSKLQIKALWHRDKTDLGEKTSDELFSLNDIDGYDLTKDKDLMSKVNISTMCLNTTQAPKINLSGLFKSTIGIIDLYYICGGCGHVYWVGDYMHY
jgi:hypothetical protein